jgi:guanylate kinase
MPTHDTESGTSYPGTLVSISGPSGVGKSTICRRLAERLGATLSVSATTRPKREDEVDGQDYFFVSKDAFERALAAGQYLEHARVYGGQYYGTPAGPVLEGLRAGRVVILEIEIEGTIQVVRRFPDTVTVYVLAPTVDDQQQRLVGRAGDSEQAIAERLAKADGEIRYAQDSGAYKCFTVNANLDATVDRICDRIRSHHESS